LTDNIITSTRIDFADPPGVDDDGRTLTTDGAPLYISVALDEEANTVDGIVKTRFAPNDAAYVAVYTNALDPYVFGTTGGHVTPGGFKFPQEITEEIVFAFAADAQLARLPAAPVDWEWVGKNPGYVPRFSGRDINLAGDVLGVLRCTYTVYFDSYAVEFDKTGQVIAAAHVPDTDARAWLAIEFTDEAGGDPARSATYQLIVKDDCTDDVVPGADVWLDGAHIGKTSADGKVGLGFLKGGSTHALKITKTGYFASDNDNLKNDEFTI
jgi:hypothetical protein